MRRGLFWLNDKQWAQIEPHLPTNQTGPARDDDRRIISGIIHMLQCGARWRDCPPDYGPCTTIYNRFNRWAKRGRWKAIFEALARCGKDGVTLSIDSTSIKAHLTQLDCCQSLAPARRFGKLSKARLRLGSQIMRCFFFLTAV